MNLQAYLICSVQGAGKSKIGDAFLKSRDYVFYIEEVSTPYEVDLALEMLSKHPSGVLVMETNDYDLVKQVTKFRHKPPKGASLAAKIIPLQIVMLQNI